MPKCESNSPLRYLRRLPIVVPAILLVAACTAVAEVTPAKLPADGSWVRYFVTMRRAGTNDDIIIKLTYSLVGTSMENGDKCRWVEIKSIFPNNHTEVFKFLISEKELLEGERPMNSLIRGWRKFDDEPAEEQKFNQGLGRRGFAGDADFYFGNYMIIFPGPQQKAKVIEEKRVIEYQQGRLELVDARAGKRVASRQAVTVAQKQTFQTDFTVWNHPTLTLGSVVGKMRVQVLFDDIDVPNRAFTEDLTVEDFGSDAKSALPEIK